MAIARSPITQCSSVTIDHGWEVSNHTSQSSLTLSDQTPLSKVHIRAPKTGLAAKAIGVPFGRAERTERNALVIGSGPGEWLVLGEIDGAREMVSEWTAVLSQTAGSEELITVLDQTHGRALMRLTGRASPQLLAKLCGIDFADEVTPDGAALRTSVAKLVTDVVRNDQGRELSFLLHCERSSGQYLFDSVLDAGAEFGIDAQGFFFRG